MAFLKTIGCIASRNSKPFATKCVLSNRISQIGIWSGSSFRFTGLRNQVQSQRFLTSEPKIDVHKLLKQQNFKEMVQEIEQQSKQRAIIPFTEFGKLCKDKGLSKSDAKVLAEGLETVGTVLQVHGDGEPVSLYLQPQIIHNQLMHTVDPNGLRFEERKKELEALEAKKIEMDNTLELISRKSLRIAKIKTALMACTCVGVLSVMARFTWWTYSWDIMEPVTYFVGATLSTGCMFYVAWSNQEYGTADWLNQWKKMQMKKYQINTNFNISEYESLKAQIEELNVAMSSPRPQANSEKHDN